MTVINLQEAFSHLDDELIDNYLTCRSRNRARLARRQVMRKRVLTCAACFMLVAAVTFSAVYHVRYPAIPLENTVGEVSARYVPEWMVKKEEFIYIPNYNETELFERADYIFSGTITSIKQIAINFNKRVLYRTILTVETDCVYKGNDLSTIRVYTRSTHGNDTLLNYLSEGDYGIFITQKIDENDLLSHNNASFPFTDIADAQLIDNYGFGFAMNQETKQINCYDTVHEHPDKLFASLPDYEWNSIVEYITAITNVEPK